MDKSLSKSQLEQRVAELGPFYHNIALPFGIQTAPEQKTPARGENYPLLCDALPQDLTGMSVLDIGCNAGAFSIECKRRGAERVVGFDYSDKFIEQAKFCAQALGLDIEYSVGNFFDYLKTCGKFDIVVFVGVLYHLQDPIGVAQLVRGATRQICLLETVGVDPKFRNFEEGLIQFPRPKIAHSGHTWINKEGLRHIFTDVARFSEFNLLFNGSRIGALLRV